GEREEPRGRRSRARGAGVGSSLVMEGAFKKRTSKAGVTVVPRPETLAKATWLPALARGLGVTMRHFFTNIATGKDIATVQYPEEKVPYPQRNRGLHRLMLRDDGTVPCAPSTS